jgi:hypothetical protein
LFEPEPKILAAVYRTDNLDDQILDVKASSISSNSSRKVSGFVLLFSLDFEHQKAIVSSIFFTIIAAKQVMFCSP